MERVEIFTAKSFDEAKAMAAKAFDVDELDIQFEIIEQPTKKLFGGIKGEFRVRAIYRQSTIDNGQLTVKGAKGVAASAKKSSKTAVSAEVDMEKFEHIISYIDKVLTHLGAKDYAINVKPAGDSYIIDISGDKLGVIIGRRGETLDALQYLAILANNRAGEENARLRLVVDCNGYREKRAETLETLATRTSAKVIKQGRRITLEPMNPYERRIIHSKVASIDGVYSSSVGDEPYRKVVISAEVAKRNPKRTPAGGGNRSTTAGRGSTSSGLRERTPGAVSNAVQSKSYKQSKDFSTSFEREYKRSQTSAEEISQDTVDVEKNANLYGKIEL